MGANATGIWKELRRRHVVRTGAGYAAVAFVSLQLAEILFPTFGLGDAAVRALVAVILAGFPVILSLSWVYDFRGGGLHRTLPADAEAGGESVLPGPPIWMVGGVLIGAAVVGFMGMYAVLHFEPPVATREAAIAVLPFADMSVEGDQAYLGDGLAEEILNILAGTEGLKVAARTSSFSFRDSPDDVRDIGRQLGVTTLLEGSVRRDGQQVRVTAQLIDTATGFHLWSANFDRTVDDLFAVQDEIAGAIVAELVGRLDVAPAGTVRHEPPAEAVDAYWKGRAEWNRRGVAGMPSAINLFSQAIGLDSAYAQAYAGLADSYALLPQVAPATDADEAWRQAESYARKAIDLNPGLAEAHASLGLVLAFQGDRAGALESFGRAISLNPSYASAYHWRANVLAEMGQLGPALTDAAQAAALDPLSVPIATDHGLILLWSGRVDEAGTRFDQAIRSDFGYARAHFGAALVGLAQGEPFPVQMSLVQWAAVSGLPTDVVAQVADDMLAFEATGAPGVAPPMLGALVDSRQMNAGTAASLAALVGARDEMLAWLRRAVDDRSWVEQFLLVNTVYDPYRGEPAFREVLAQVTAR